MIVKLSDAFSLLGMLMTFLACRAYSCQSGVESRLVQMDLNDLTEGDVVVKVAYSSVNYKDALAATGRGKILKTLPLNVGIDLAGEVFSSQNPAYQAGDKVLVNGCGLGEVYDGGLAQFASVNSQWIVPLPEQLTAGEAMSIGTAGFTAALALHRMQLNGVCKDSGSIVVTGASGGVGSLAVDILSKGGYSVVAVSNREDKHDYLTALGAEKVMTLQQLELGKRPLEKARFAGVIDNLGGQTLSQLLAHVQPWGSIASIGMAQASEIDASVFPFILRGVSMLGISSTNCPIHLRKQIWQRLGNELKPQHLEKIVTQCVSLENVTPIFNQLLDKKLFGRVLVDCR